MRRGGKAALAVAGVGAAAALLIGYAIREDAGPTFPPAPQPTAGQTVEPRPYPPPVRPSEPSSPEPATASPAAGEVFVAEIASLADGLNSPETTAQDDLDILDALLEFYRRVYRGNPAAGVNAEVVDALTGRNEKRVALIRPDHPGISKAGELLDRWGTPYFFHALSAQHMEIVSAGPDRDFWTGDDVRLDPVGSESPAANE